MPTNRSTVPKLRLHKATGQALVVINGKSIYLGKHGTARAQEEYDRLISEWLCNGRQLGSRLSGPTIAELILAYWNYAQTYYRKNDKTTDELYGIKAAMRPLKKAYGSLSASDFGPLKLKAVRTTMIDARHCRKYINDNVNRIKRMFKWAVENELVPSHVFHGLQAVSGLKRGRSKALETDPVKPVPDEFVDVIKSHVARQVWAMVQIQRLTGMRPGEVVIMRSRDIDTQGEVWSYKPSSHKTEHHGHRRIIELGPKAQKVIRPFLKPDLEGFLFSPSEAEAERHADQRCHRQSKVQPSQKSRRRRNPKCRPRDHYSVASYRRAIQRGCEQADEAAKKAAGLPQDSERLVPQWHPHQLRHSYATRIRKEHGLEIARILLGHKSMAVSEIYAEVDRSKVADVVARTG